MKKILLFLLLAPLTLSAADTELAALQTRVAQLEAQVLDHQRSLTGEGDGFFRLVVKRVVEALRADRAMIARVADKMRLDEVASGTIATQAALEVAEQLRNPDFMRDLARNAAPEIVQDEAAMRALVEAVASYIVHSGSLSNLVADHNFVTRVREKIRSGLQTDEQFITELAGNKALQEQLVAALMLNCDSLLESHEATDDLSPQESSAVGRRASSTKRRLVEDTAFLDTISILMRNDPTFAQKLAEKICNCAGENSLLEGVSRCLEPKVEAAIERTMQERLLQNEAFLTAVAARIPAPLSPVATPTTPPPSVQDFFQDLLEYLQRKGAGRVHQVMEEVALRDQVPPQTPTTQTMLENAGQRAQVSRGLIAKDSLQGWRFGETRVSTRTGRPSTLI